MIKRLLTVCVATLAARHASAAEPVRITSISVEPTSITLSGPRSVARFIVTAKLSDGSFKDVTDRAVSKARKPFAASPAAGEVKPINDGDTILDVSVGSLKAQLPVSVKNFQVRKPIDFNREVEPILTRNGCNSGGCHGAQYGKGGFKLSLAAFDMDVDYHSLVKQSSGRRINVSDPTTSLILRKPTLTLPHSGGSRLVPGSDDYLRIAEWIQDGAPGPTKDDPSVTAIDVFPSKRIMTLGANQRYVVRATYSDGSVEDVTRWARFNSLNDSIAAVTPDGKVTVGSRGETSLMIRFGGQVAVSTVTVPFTKTAPRFDWVENNLIDGLTSRKWKSLGLAPSTVCDDATFLRRIGFDLIGTPPSPEEVTAFLADRSPDKREKAVDRILQRPEYADYWALKWGDLLRSNRTLLGSAKGMWSFTNWIRAQFRDNRPFDGFVRELITAQGSTFANGPANYYRVATNPTDLAETTSQVFLGMRLQCTKCHHHPFERWSQEDYYRFAGFFARVGSKGSNEYGIFGAEQVVRVVAGGDTYHPKDGRLMRPSPLGGYPERMRVKDTKTAALVDPDPDVSGDRRTVLANWLTTDNMPFARNIVNRYWGYLMGRGIVEPVDDLRVSNPPSNPELLDALAAELIRNKYDVKQILKLICTSRTYQLSSESTKESAGDSVYFTHYNAKRLPAEVLLDSLNLALDTKTKFDGLPLGTRAIELPDPNVNNLFLDTFGRAPRTIACECERGAEPNMGQALHLMMGDLLNEKVQDRNNRLNKMIAAKKSDQEIIETLYMATLGRAPKPSEMGQTVKLVSAFAERPGIVPPNMTFFVPPIAFNRDENARQNDRRTALEDVLWALLNSKEFVLNR